MARKPKYLTHRRAKHISPGDREALLKGMKAENEVFDRSRRRFIKLIGGGILGAGAGFLASRAVRSLSFEPAVPEPRPQTTPKKQPQKPEPKPREAPKPEPKPKDEISIKRTMHATVDDPILDKSPHRDKIVKTINKYAKEYDHDPHFMFALARHESVFDPNAVGPTNDKGLIQLTPIALKDVKQKRGFKVTDPFDIDQNVKAAAMYLDILKKDYGKSRLKGLQGRTYHEWVANAYNKGPRAFKRRSPDSSYTRKVIKHYDFYRSQPQVAASD